MLGILILNDTGTCLEFTFGTGDIPRAFMQSGPIIRDVNVRSPRDLQEKGFYWKFLNITRGLVDSWRKYFKSREMDDGGIQPVTNIPRLTAIAETKMLTPVSNNGGGDRGVFGKRYRGNHRHLFGQAQKRYLGCKKGEGGFKFNGCRKRPETGAPNSKWWNKYKMKQVSLSTGWSSE